MADLEQIFRSTVASLAAEPLVVAELAHAGAELLAVPEVTVVALGKAAPAMARGAAKVLRGAARGVVVAPAEAEVPPGFELVVGDHPVPRARSLAAGARVLERVTEAPEDGAVLFLISGGASALCELPIDGVPLERVAAATESLLLGGADIRALNAVRKHLSRIKGGRLAGACRAQVRTALVVSDVVGDALDAVGSGPTVADPTTYEDALAAFQSRDLPVDTVILDALGRGLRGELPETPKPGDPKLAAVDVRLVAGVAALAERAAQMCTRAGLAPVSHPTLDGPLDAAALSMIRAAKKLTRGQVLVASGEVTIRAHGPGQGGRAQHLAVMLARALADEPVQILVAGSDGHDFVTGAAGALLDGRSWARAIERGLEPDQRLAAFDSATLCRVLGAQLPAFDSDTNLTDLVLVARTE